MSDHSDFNDLEKHTGDPQYQPGHSGLPGSNAPKTADGKDFETAQGPGDAPDSVKGKVPAPVSPYNVSSRRPGFDTVHMKLLQGLMANPNIDWRQPIDPALLDTVDRKTNQLLDRYPGYVPI